MNTTAELTNREIQVAEYLAWGVAKKEAAAAFKISTRTVEAITRNIYKKLGIQKATELCVWWFCTKCGISFDLSPIKRKIIAVFLLAIFLPYDFSQKETIVRPREGRQTETVRVVRSRRNEDIN